MYASLFPHDEDGYAVFVQHRAEHGEPETTYEDWHRLKENARQRYRALGRKRL